MKRKMLAAMLLGLLLHGSRSVKSESGSGIQDADAIMEVAADKLEWSEALSILAKEVPEAHDKFLRLKERRPEAFHKVMAKIGPLIEDPKSRPAALRSVQARLRVRDAMKLYRQSSGKKKEEVKRDLENALSGAFDAKLALQELGLKRGQHSIEEQRQRKAEFIHARMTLLSEASGNRSGRK